MTIRGWAHRKWMLFIHRHGYHKMEVSHPEGDTLHWCHWCGIRVVLKRECFAGMKIAEDSRVPKNTIILTNIGYPQS